MSASNSPSVAEPDLRLLPAALAAWLGMWVATAGHLWLLGPAAALALIVLLWAWRRRSWPLAAVGLVLLLCLATGGMRWWLWGGDQLRTLAEQRAIVVVQAELVGSPLLLERKGVRPQLWIAPARVVEVDGRGQTWSSGAVVEVSASGDLANAWRELAPGSRVSATVQLSIADPAEPVQARAREPPALLAPPNGPEAAVEHTRQGLRDSVAGLSDGPRALVPALVVGDTGAMPTDLVAQFKATGLTHLTAVSGANLALLLSFLRIIARWVGVRGWWLRGLLVLGVVAFVLLCRAEPSVVRAAAMGLVALAALGWSESGASIRPLCVAVIAVLLVDPAMSRSLGFSLSVLATCGIIAWGRRWTEALRRWLPLWLSEGLAVSLAAQLATQPVVTALSGQVSVVGLLANLVAAPLVGPATVFGLLAACIAQLWLPLATVVGWLAGVPAQALCWIAWAGSSLPGAQVPWPATPLALGVVTVGCLGLALVLGRVLSRPGVVIGVAVVLVIVLLRPPVRPGWPPPDWAVVFCDVGQGDATALRAGPDAAVVVDAGPEPARVLGCLRELGITRISGLVLTHFHADHIGGVTGVTDVAAPARVITSAATSPAGGVSQVAGATIAAPRTVAVPGTVLTAGAVRLSVLAALQQSFAGLDEGESAAENDGSLVMRAQVQTPGGTVTVLLAGDVQEEGQAAALRAVADLHADLLLVPHHGSPHQDAEFLAAVSPRLAVFSVGLDNDYGHPSARTVSLVQRSGATIARTDRQGSVAVSLVDGRLILTTQR